MQAIQIRAASLADIEGVGALFDAYRQFYQQAPDLEKATQFIRDRLVKQESVLLVAENTDKNLLGFCQMYPTFCSVVAAPIMVLYDLFVSAENRKSGAGRALMLAAQAHAKLEGYVRLDLSTAKTNLTAQALYESLAWVRDEQFFTYSLQLNS